MRPVTQPWLEMGQSTFHVEKCRTWPLTKSALPKVPPRIEASWVSATTVPSSSCSSPVPSRFHVASDSSK